MKATVKWIDQVSFVAETGSGHAVVVDGSPDAGGRNIGPRPMELVLAGTAACTAFDVVWILKKARQPISGCTVDAEVERAPADPKVFTRMHFVYRIRGEGLNPAQVDRLRDEFAVYLVRSGRLCVAGLNTGNVEATGLAMAAVLDG